MDYIEVSEALHRPGLRLALTAGFPGPWSEAAKGIFKVKGIAYTAVRQRGGEKNEELLAWTRQNSAPCAVYENERPRGGWAEILFLAERLQPQPRLVPVDPRERALMFGLAHEICGEQGLGWTRRLTTGGADRPQAPDTMGWKFGFNEAETMADAPRRINEILALLSAQLQAQRSAGSRFFVGAAMSAADIYWTTFSNMVRPLPPELSPMPPWLRKAFSQGDFTVDPVLIEHRDWMFDKHLGLPQDY